MKAPKIAGKAFVRRHKTRTTPNAIRKYIWKGISIEDQTWSSIFAVVVGQHGKTETLLHPRRTRVPRNRRGYRSNSPQLFPRATPGQSCSRQKTRCEQARPPEEG